MKCLEKTAAGKLPYDCMNPWRLIFLIATALLPAAAGACDACRTMAITGPVVEYDLYIEENPVSPAGKVVRGLTINGGIPGPTLKFREGDFARIRVHNRLPRETTSTHWHVLVSFAYASPRAEWRVWQHCSDAAWW